MEMPKATQNDYFLRTNSGERNVRRHRTAICSRSTTLISVGTRERALGKGRKSKVELRRVVRKSTRHGAFTPPRQWVDTLSHPRPRRPLQHHHHRSIDQSILLCGRLVSGTIFYLHTIQKIHLSENSGTVCFRVPSTGWRHQSRLQHLGLLSLSLSLSRSLPPSLPPSPSLFPISLSLRAGGDKPQKLESGGLGMPVISHPFLWRAPNQTDEIQQEQEG